MPLDQFDEAEIARRERGEMSFFDHIDQLRWHLIRSAISVCVATVVVFCFKDFVFNDIIFGPRHPDFITYRWLCGASHGLGMGETLCMTPPEFQVISRDLAEFFTMHLMVSFWLGIVVCFPYVFWEFWRFIGPGLYEAERKAVTGLVFICTALFLAGVLFGYYIIAPFSISFLAGYTIEGAAISPTLESYVNYMVMFTLPTGLVFEMPILSYFLAKIGILGPQIMRKFRRHAIVVIFILAAVITPSGDLFTQTLVASPLLILYEVSIWVAARVKKNKEAALSNY